MTCASGRTRHSTAPTRLLRPTALFEVPLPLAGGQLPAPGDGSSYRDRFTGPYGHRILKGIGHNLPQEALTAFTQAVIDADHL